MGIELKVACTTCQEYYWTGSMKHAIWKGFQMGNQTAFWWFARHRHADCCVQIFADTQEPEWMQANDWDEHWYQAIFVEPLKQWYRYIEALEWGSLISLEKGEIDKIPERDLTLIEPLPTNPTAPFLPFDNQGQAIYQLAFISKDPYEVSHPYEPPETINRYCEDCQTYHQFDFHGYYEGYINNPSEWQNPLLIDYSTLNDKSITTYWAMWITDLVNRNINIKTLQNPL